MQNRLDYSKGCWSICLMYNFNFFSAFLYALLMLLVILELEGISICHRRKATTMTSPICPSHLDRIPRRCPSHDLHYSHSSPVHQLLRDHTSHQLKMWVFHWHFQWGRCSIWCTWCTNNPWDNVSVWICRRLNLYRVRKCWNFMTRDLLNCS